MDTNKSTIIVCRRAFFLLLVYLFSCSFSFSQSSKREYTIKAGFIYKFMFFARWPKSYAVNTQFSVIIGILGENPFGDIFNVLEGEKVEGKPISLQYFGPDTPAADLRRCRILYIHPSMEPQLGNILEMLEKYPVLTVSEIRHFTQKGGMINFVIKNNRVEFEINKNAAQQVGIKLSSKLLRLAIHVIDATHSDQNDETRWEDTP